jgi:hypothetical protein
MGGPVGYRTDDSKPQVGPVSRCSGRTAGSPPHPFDWAGLARFEPRRLVSTSERRLPGENVCYLRNLGTDEPLTSMNGMARGRATSSLSPEPTEPTEP